VAKLTSTVAVAVVGPTAVGKSELGVQLAHALDGEVVNADSMQLYRGMDIGTAKLSVAQRRGVPHHLLDVLDVRADATVAGYQRAARAAVADVLSRGRSPILVGGSGLYVTAVLEPLRFPATDPALRSRLEGELAEIGRDAMHARLAASDAAAAAAIAPTNSRRVVRALEVLELTGAPYTSALPPAGGRSDVAWVRLGLHSPRADLDARIARRVDRMWADGLEREVRSLVDAGLREGRTAPRALGYAQVLAMLDGTCGEQEARAATVQGTRRLVRRQESWFGRDRFVRWLPADAEDLLSRALTTVAQGAGGNS
jgi:tRNA dimethylallyltransferase